MPKYYWSLAISLGLHIHQALSRSPRVPRVALTLPLYGLVTVCLAASGIKAARITRENDQFSLSIWQMSWNLCRISNPPLRCSMLPVPVAHLTRLLLLASPQYTLSKMVSLVSAYPLGNIGICFCYTVRIRTAWMLSSPFACHLRFHGL